MVVVFKDEQYDKLEKSEKERRNTKYITILAVQDMASLSRYQHNGAMFVKQNQRYGTDKFVSNKWQ